jgi:hypothetical protein
VYSEPSYSFERLAAFITWEANITQDSHDAKTYANLNAYIARSYVNTRNAYHEHTALAKPASP